MWLIRPTGPSESCPCPDQYIETERSKRAKQCLRILAPLLAFPAYGLRDNFAESVVSLNPRLLGAVTST
eukprot:457515-Rhodomonas_salina.1